VDKSSFVRPTDERLGELAADSKTVVFAEITRRKHARRVRGRVATIASAALLLTGGVILGVSLQQPFPVETPSATSFSIPAPLVPADALQVTVTCAGTGTFNLELTGDTEGARAGSCSDADQKKVVAFALEGSTSVQTLAIADSGVEGGIAVAADYLYSAGTDFSLGQDSGASSGIDPDGTAVPVATLPATGTAEDGASITGRVRLTDVQPPDVIYLDPDARQDWFVTFRKNYPNGQGVPLYGEDGITRIGTYLVTY